MEISSCQELQSSKGTEGSDSSVESSRFRNSSGVYYTRQLFLELCGADKGIAIYSLRPEDHERDGVVYPSLRRIYLEMGDESEYHFANKYFGGWPHWLRLTSAPWFLGYLEPIRQELKVKLLAENLAHIQAKARKGDYHANKYLLERGYSSPSSVGRPSKAKIKAEAEKLFQEKNIFADDLSRMKEYL